MYDVLSKQSGVLSENPDRQESVKNRLSLIRDTMKLYSAYIDNTTIKTNCGDVAFNLQQMIFTRLEALEQMEI